MKNREEFFRLPEWQSFISEIRKEINSPLTISSEYSELNLLNSSKSFSDVLKKNEYESSIEIDENLIIAKAEFSKSLPFEFKLQSFTNNSPTLYKTSFHHFYQQV
jgi:hypothetical protein